MDVELYEEQGSDHLLDAVLSAIPEPFFVYDINGRYIDVIGGSDRKKYHDARSLVGKTLYDIFPMSHARMFHDRILEAIELSQVVTFEYSINPEDIDAYREQPGPVGLRWFEAHISPLKRSTQQTPLVVWVAFDITDHKELVELQELQKAKLRELAMTDPLTGFLNRRSFFEVSQLEVLKARGHESAGFFLCMIDIDHFKRVNDRYGHQLGDRVLNHIASVMRKAVRSDDSIGRLGGEEFALIIPGDSLSRASVVAQRILEEIDGSPYRNEEFTIHSTVSIGLSQYRTSEEDVQLVLKRADLALYEAKRLGRNRVELYAFQD
jgi:diguanylate cyclase (GGDEF)-like protein